MQMQQMKNLVEQGDGERLGPVKALNWMTYKPSSLFHPVRVPSTQNGMQTLTTFKEWWVQSLDDTPDVFRGSQTRDVDLRRDLNLYLSSGASTHIARNPSYTIGNVRDNIKDEDLELLDIFDIYHQTDFSFRIKARNGRDPKPESDSIEVVESHDGMYSPSSSSTKVESESSPYDRMWAALNDSVRLPSHQALCHVNLLSSWWMSVPSIGYCTFASVQPPNSPLTAPRFSQKVSPELVGGFVYMWHPDALDAVDDHFGAMSRFSESRESLMWTTSITISQCVHFFIPLNLF